MIIDTPDFLRARFFMRDESLEGIDDLPRVAPHQVHASRILHVTDGNFGDYALPSRPEADGVLLTTTRAGASLRFADCAPVLLWGEGWSMILHSGYKGTVLGITGEGLGLVRGLYGDEAVRGAHAWVGPCIGREEYCRDIDDEWTQRGLKSFDPENYDIRGGKVYFDLAAEIVKYFIIAGGDEGNITLSGINTYTEQKCYSYRRGDKTGRMTLYVKRQ